MTVNLIVCLLLMSFSSLNSLIFYSSLILYFLIVYIKINQVVQVQAVNIILYQLLA